MAPRSLTIISGGRNIKDYLAWEKGKLCIMTMLDPQWPERPINSLQEFHEIVAAIGAHWPNTDRCLFRGQAQSAWTLLPTLARETAGSKFGWQEIIRLELELMHYFRQEAHRTLPQAVLPRRDYILDW